MNWVFKEITRKNKLQKTLTVKISFHFFANIIEWEDQEVFVKERNANKRIRFFVCHYFYYILKRMRSTQFSFHFFHSKFFDIIANMFKLIMERSSLYFLLKQNRLHLEGKNGKNFLKNFLQIFIWRPKIKRIKLKKEEKTLLR